MREDSYWFFEVGDKFSYKGIDCEVTSLKGSWIYYESTIDNIKYVSQFQIYSKIFNDIKNKIMSGLTDLGTLGTCAEKKQSEKIELTFGERLVGLTFNPSGDDKVNKAKKLCAELADLVNQSFYEGEQDVHPLDLKHQLFNHTIGEILNAQMNVVKLLTLKH